MTRLEGTSAATPRAWLMTVLVGAYASNFVDRTIVNVLQQPIKQELGLRDWQLGLLGGTSFAIFYTVLGIYVARLAERRDRVTILTLCILAWSAFTAMCGFVTSFVQLLLLRIGVAIGEAGATPTGHSLISDHYPVERRAGALAIFHSGNTLGSVLGALIGGFVGQAYGWRWAFVVAGIPGLALAAITFFTIRDPRRHTPVAANDVPPLAEVARLLLRKSSFRHLALGAGVMLFGSYGIFAFVTAHFMRSFALPLSEASLIGGVGTGLVLGVGTISGGFLAQRLAVVDRRWLVWTTAAALALAAPLCALTFTATSVLPASILFLTMAMLLGVFQGPLFAALHSLVAPRMRATASAILLLGTTLLGLGLGPLVIGLVSDLLAIRAFRGFGDLCRAGTFADPRCVAASAEGLRIALTGCAVIFAWAATHFALAGRTIREEMVD